MSVGSGNSGGEQARLDALRRYAILDSEPDKCFDRIAKLTASQFNVPIAMITLIDEDRQWLKACYGLPSEDMPREHAVCAHTINRDRVMVVLNLSTDPRFSQNPLVTGEKNARFYAGAPLITSDGHRLGALCVLDTVPRDAFSDVERELLAGLAAVVVDEIEMKYAVGDVLTEVEKRQDLEEQLRLSEAEIELLFDAIPVRIFYKDDKNRILRVNKMAAESMGMTVEEVNGRDVYEMFPDTAKEYHDADLKVIESGQPNLGIVTRWESPPYGWTRTDRVPYTDPKTGDRYVLATSVDITTEKQAIDRLEASIQRYRDLYNKTPVMLHSADAGGFAISVSDFWLNRLGYRRDEVLGKEVLSFLTPESREQVSKDAIPELYRTGSCTDLECQVVCKSGQILDVLQSGVCEYDVEGNVIRTMIVSQDVTAQRVAERKLAELGADSMSTKPEVAGSSCDLQAPAVATEQHPDDRPLAAVTERQEDWGKGETILIVEQESSVRDITVGVLQFLGYTTVVADSREEALAVLNTDIKIALLFTDTDFTEAARHLRPSLPVLLAQDDEDSAETSDALVVKKPYQREVLAKAIRAALGDEQPDNADKRATS